MIRCFIKRTVILLLTLTLVVFVVTWFKFVYLENVLYPFQTYKIEKFVPYEIRQHDEILWDWNGSNYVYEEDFDWEDFQRYLHKRKSYNKKIIQLQDIHSKYANNEPDCIARTTFGQASKQFRRVFGKRSDSWVDFFENIGDCYLYKEYDANVQRLLDDMATLPIISVENFESGTQVKLKLIYKDGNAALFKPMRFPRNYETMPNHFYFTDFERHVAEIAAFHLDKVLGFRRSLPTVGRFVNISNLYSKATKNSSIIFFESPVKNRCFVGKCKYYCDTSHAICGKPDTIEGSIQVFLPNHTVAIKQIASPYHRTYSKHNQLSEWQINSSYCEHEVKPGSFGKSSRRLLDAVDVSIFDFLMGNQDRHNYDTIAGFQKSVYLLHMDNGRGFGRSAYDDMDILAPLIQCCVIRTATLTRLLKYYFGEVTLSETLVISLSKDPVNPVLAKKHYPAIERRLETILYSVFKCINDQRSNAGDMCSHYKNVVMNQFIRK